jgi:hypothetical protein
VAGKFASSASLSMTYVTAAGGLAAVNLLLVRTRLQRIIPAA